MGTRRSGFVLDAKSMDINRVSTPRSTSTKRQSGQCTPPMQDGPSLDCASTSASTPTPGREDGSIVGACGLELESCGSHTQCTSSSETMPTEYYRGLIKKLKEQTGDAGHVNFKLNTVFLDRLGDIDCLDGQGHDPMYLTQLRLVTFQEWVDFLLQVNSAVLGNTADLEKEAYSKIVSYFNSVKGQQQQALEENRKLRRDLCSIIKLVQSGYHRCNWDFESISLETLTVNQLLGLKGDMARPDSESEKMAECMKSLVNELAEKHDEICHLKTQLGTLDEFVLTARQKLLFKDQCIAQLNQQLQEISQSVDNMPQQTTNEASPVVAKDMEEAFDQSKVEENSSESITNSMLQTLTHQERKAREILGILDQELNDFLNLHNLLEHQTTIPWRNRVFSLIETVAKLNDTNEYVAKLESIRSQLNLLEANWEYLDLTTPPNMVDDADFKMLENFRERMRTLNELNRDLEGKYVRLETESRIRETDLQAKLDFESGLNQRNSQILKEIADLIGNLNLTDFSYDIYEDSSTENPFCDAIQEMFVQKSQEKLRQEEYNSDTKTSSQTKKESTKARPAAMAKAKTTTRPTTKPTTKPATKPTTTTRPRSAK